MKRSRSTMFHRAILALACVAGLVAPPLVAAAAPVPPRTPAPAPASAARPGGAPRKAQAHPTPREGRATRTLEEIAIQGEIDVPDVLFITGRPRPFHDDRLHRNYSPTTRQLLEALTTPGAVLVRPVGPTREASR